MREERGRISGNVVIREPYTLWGAIGGNVRVGHGGKMYVRGAIYGHLIADRGGRVHIFGNVQGNVIVRRKSKVIVSGVVGGDVLNQGGRLFIDTGAKVMGGVKTAEGAETSYQAPDGTYERPTDKQVIRDRRENNITYRHRFEGDA